MNFKNKIPSLSEEHIKQICRFTDTPYVKGQWQTMRAYAEFKIWHLKLQQADKIKENSDGSSL